MPRLIAALALIFATAFAVPAAAQPPRPVVGPRVLIAYLSKSGNTEAMARAVAEGVKSVPGAAALLMKIGDVKEADLLGADAIIVGTPVYNGGVAAEVKQFMERWPFGRLKEKVGAAFCTSGGTSAGEELALMDILSSMLVFQFVLVGGDTWEAAFGASAITEEGKSKEKAGVDDAAKAKARGLGARVARVAAKLKDGR